MRTAATFLALLSQGSKQPLNPPLNEGRQSGVAVRTLPTASVAAWHTTATADNEPPDPTTSLSDIIARHCLEQTSIHVVVLTTPLRQLQPRRAAARDALNDEERMKAADQEESVRRDLEALRKASQNAVTVVMTSRADSTADIVVVIRGLGLLPISCKKYEDGTTSALCAADVAEELWKMGAVVEQSALPAASRLLDLKAFAAQSEKHRVQMRNLGLACGLEGGALRIVGFQLAFVAATGDFATAVIASDLEEVVPMSLAQLAGCGSTPLEPARAVKMVAALAAVPVKYFACGSTFENTFPLQRFSPIERETSEMAVGAKPFGSF